MRCLACNDLLKDYEATRRSLVTGEFLDLCNDCVGKAGILTLDPLPVIEGSCERLPDEDEEEEVEVFEE